MNYYDNLLLNEALNDSTIKSDTLKILINMKKIKVDKVHSYVITSPKNSCGRWQTYVKTEGGKRKKISAMSEDTLYNKLYEHYFCTVTTLSNLYPEWLERRKNQNISARTVKKNTEHWKKYYLNSKLIQMPLTKITPIDIEDFLYLCMKKYPMTVKILNNMRFIIKDMLCFAYRKGLINSNPYEHIQVNTSACLPEAHKNDSSRVYNSDEVKKLFQSITYELSEYPENTDSYAILILFKLGLRIGEVCALKFSDIDYENKEIHIHRMETLDIGSDEKLHPVVVNHTKKKSPYGDRYLPLSNYEIEIFQKVKHINDKYNYTSDFIFCDTNGRTKIWDIDNKIRKLCNKANIIIKSAHDIRRTVASEMHKNGIPLEMIRKYLGHSTIQTTMGYIYDNNTEEENRKMIQKALNNLNKIAK